MIALLAAVGSVGCKTGVAPQAVVDPAAAPAYNPAPAYNNDPGPGGPGANDYPSYATRRYVRTISPPPVVEQTVEQDGGSYTERVSSYPNRESRSRRVVVTHRRPVSHSVAIVGGSAAGGAAIGALAGGGKGAGIGALAGGGAGFIYDRLTHKRKVVVEERQ
jgi:uncharacterized protein YcfJ